ncbi:MAG: hypothetical protein HYU64_10095 [Armatimonadetes bacterium]|nr:hypothetical protein [Armatimonadota bacterium]
MSPDAAHALIVAAVFMGIFALGEGVRKAVPHKPEIARKTVHFLGGLTALSFPYLIRSHWTVLGLAVTFAGIIVLAGKLGILKAIHGVERESRGDLYFPISIYLVFFLSRGNPVLYIISILVMTAADALAALVGGKYGTTRFDVEGNLKSLEGSLVFFLITFLCVHLPLLFLTDAGRVETVLIALIIALLVTGFEAISLSGSDNLFVPLGTFYILAKMTPHPLWIVADQLKLLGFIAGLTLLTFSLPPRFLKTSGLIGAILLNYGAWGLCGFEWFLPLYLAEILCYLVIRYFATRVKEDIVHYQIRILLYTALVPTLLLFAANSIEAREMLFLPYLTSVAGQITVILYFFFFLVPEGGGPILNVLARHKSIAAFFSGAVSTVFIAGLPALLYRHLPLQYTIALAGAGTLLSTALFHGLISRYPWKEDEMLIHKMRLVSVGAGVLLVSAVEVFTSWR